MSSHRGDAAPTALREGLTLAASWPAGIFALLCAGAILLAFGGTQPASEEARSLEAERAYADLPLAFEENVGQAPTRVDYIARTDGASAAISSSGAILALSGKKSSEAIELGLLGASPSEPEALAKLPGEVNYLVGDDQSKWRTGLPTFERVRYSSVYPGIDVLWHGRQDALEYDFRLAPNADPDRIAMRVAGAKDLSVAQNGDLVIDAGRGSVRQKAPVAYQERAGERIRVDASYRVDGERVSFDLGPYDRSRPLVIDPVVLAYSTYLGGGGTDEAHGIAVDSQGSAYIGGVTTSTDFDTVGPIEGDSANSDVFVSKLNPQGSALVYSTYLGGGSSDFALAIAVDSQGAAYIAGGTDSSDFDTVGPIEGDSGSRDVFVSKLNPAGSGLAYSTYLGGGGLDVANGIAVDSQGAAYVTGETASADFDTVGPIEVDSHFSSDVFVSKLNPQGSELVYSTYLGGSNFEAANGIAVDPEGAAYIAGTTASIDFDTVGPIESDSEGNDAFVSKLNPQGSALAYSTYLGGDGEDAARAIAVDPDGAAYVAGRTTSNDFDTVNPIEGDSTADDAFVSKLHPQGSTLVYSTYLGGNSLDHAHGIAIDSDGAAYVAGETFSTDFNTESRIEGDAGSQDAFVSKLNPAGSGLVYSTYLGGDGNDRARGVAVDGHGDSYVAGETSSSDFNTLNAVEGDSGGVDAFVAKLVAPTDLALSMFDSPDPVREGQDLTYTLEVTNEGPARALDARVAAALPTSATVRSTSAGCAPQFFPWLISCQLGTLAPNQTKSVQITVRPSTAGTIGSDAFASASNGDLDGSNNRVIEETTVTSAPPCQGRNATVVGTAGNDTLDGTGGADVIVGLGGGDQITGGGGDDRICPGPGTDTSAGGSGDDEFFDSASTSDSYRGGSGDDTFKVGGDPSLKVSGGGGSDSLQVTSASTALGTGAVDLGSDSDELFGPLSGTATGGDGADSLLAHTGGNADLLGGPGDDFLFGTSASDELSGGGGNDVIVGSASVDTLLGGAGSDAIDAGSGSETGASAIRAGDGNDEVRAGAGTDEVHGDAGDDILLGQDDADSLFGEAGADSCDGGSGIDTADSTCEAVVSVP